MALWWLQPGWTDAVCGCGARIYPEGDPDWGRCFRCFTEEMEQSRQMQESEAEYWREQEILNYRPIEHKAPQYDELGPILSQQQ